MRGILVLLFLIIGACAACLTTSANAQNAGQSGKSGADQWVSHQMNQPPPDTRDKYAISQDRIDEIKQLYIQAQKELEEKQRTKPSDGK
jgi:hypothetical protein